MRSRYRILEHAHAHFITGTTVAWLPIFTTALRCYILVNAFDYCRQKKGLKIHAWVILDTHVHAIVAAPDLTRVLADLKRHTARRIVEQLQAEHCDWLLRQLRYERAPTKTESHHQVWHEGSHPQAIMSDAIMLQKLDICTATRSNAGWSRRLNTGGIHPRTNGYRELRSPCEQIRGDKRQFNCRNRCRSEVQLRHEDDQSGWPANGTSDEDDRGVF